MSRIHRLATAVVRTVGCSTIVCVLACDTARADILVTGFGTPPGYVALLAGAWAATLGIETAVLAVLLSRRHDRRVRLYAGAWLSACTLPLVWFVLPEILPASTPRAARLLAAETLAPLVECALFWLAFIQWRPADARATVRDYGAIVTANLASFAVGTTAWWWLGLA